MRRVWFLYKIIESFLGLSCMAYHACGFLNVNYIQDHYTYVAVFGGFSLMSMFGCISICLKEPVSVLREGVMSLFAAACFIGISMNSMYHAEKDFHLMYLRGNIKGNIEDEYREELDLSSEPHPFFKYSKAQSVAALVCGCLYLLHSVLAFDLAMTENEESLHMAEEDESMLFEEGYEEMTFYVFSQKVHNWLNRYDWFSTLADKPFMEKELVQIRLIDN